MISVAQLRAELGPYAPATDREVEELRDWMEGIADVVLDSTAARARADQQRGEMPAPEAA